MRRHRAAGLDNVRQVIALWLLAPWFVIVAWPDGLVALIPTLIVTVGNLRWERIDRGP